MTTVRVWIYAVLTLIQTAFDDNTWNNRLDICRINLFKLVVCSMQKAFVWIYAVLTLIQTPPSTGAICPCLDICRINSYSNFIG